MINQSFANDSNLFIALALVAYAAAFFAYCAEWAFGTSSRFGKSVEALGAKQQSAKAATVGRQAAAPAVEAINSSDGGNGVTVLTRAGRSPVAHRPKRS